MDADEKLDSVPQLKLEGNKLFKVPLLLSDIYLLIENFRHLN